MFDLNFDTVWKADITNKWAAAIWINLSGAKLDEEADFDVHSAVGPPKPHQIDENLTFRYENFADFFVFGIKKTKVANLPKRALPKFRADRISNQSNRSNRSNRSISRPIDRIDRRPPCLCFALPSFHSFEIAFLDLSRDDGVF